MSRARPDFPDRKDMIQYRCHKASEEIHSRSTTRQKSSCPWEEMKQLTITFEFPGLAINTCSNTSGMGHFG